MRPRQRRAELKDGDGSRTWNAVASPLRLDLRKHVTVAMNNPPLAVLAAVDLRGTQRRFLLLAVFDAKVRRVLTASKPTWYPPIAAMIDTSSACDHNLRNGSGRPWL